MILSQLFVTSSLFDNFYMENNWDRLGAAVWITVLVTVPAAVVAFVAFILAVIMSIRQKYVKKR